MVSGNFISNSGTNLNLYVEWSSTANVSANTSTVTAKVYMRSYTISGTALADSYITINGNKKSFAGLSLSKTSNSLTNTLLATHTVTVAHGSDGKKSITIKANLEFNGTVSGKYLSDVTASKTVALENIPRSSTFSVSSSVNTGSNLTVKITPSSSSFKHRFEFIVNGTVKHDEYVDAGVTSYSHTIPHNWLPKTTSQTITLNCYTYSGSTKIASVKKTFTANVPSNIKPSVSKVTTSLVGGLGGKYVQGKSKVTLTATAKPGDGSTISSYIFKGANINGTSSSYTGTSNVKTSSVIQSSGTVTYKVAVKDARGRMSDYYSVSVSVYAYATPQISSIKAQRCLKDGTLDNDGTYAKVTVKVSYSTVGGSNTRTVTLSSDIDDFAKKTTVLDTGSTSVTYSGVYGGSFDLDTSYKIKAIITDKYTSHESSVTLKVAQRTINIARYGNGVALGGLSTVTSASHSGLFECHWPSKFNGLMVSTGGIRTEADGASNKYFETRRTNPPDATDAAHKNVKMQMYVGDAGYPTIRNQYSTDGGENWTTRSYLKLQDDGLYAANGRFTSNGDANATQQNDVPLRIGTASAEHIDIDSNEIMAKDSPTTLGTLALSGATVDLYAGTTLTLRVGSDTTSEYVESDITYNRTYDGSPNMYITSNGVFGRSTSSSQRYKTDIENVKDDGLNPYNILNIPIRQYKYNEDNIPIGKDSNNIYIGMIAEEVAKAYPAAAEYDEDGQVEMWNIKVIVPAMLKIIQDQQKEISELKQKVDEIKNED